MRTSALILLITAMAIVLISPIPASAREQGDAQRFDLRPVPADNLHVTEKGYFIYSLEAGGDTTGAALARNTGTQPITVQLAPVDATTAQKGGSAFADVSSAPTQVATWLQLDQASVTLDPKKQQKIGFTIHAPATIKPGQHLAGIAAYLQDIPSANAKSQTRADLAAPLSPSRAM